VQSEGLVRCPRSYSASARRYAKMSGVEVMADRYAKFRRLGMFSEFPVRGGRVAQANKEREQARRLP